MAGLNFKGKSFVQNHHLLVKYHQLIPRKDKSLTDKVSLRDNLIIHGDNLKALKALLPMYAGKVKCIYIDPPYNTGNENWVYNDNVNSPMMQDWLGKVVDREDLTRHDKWLCMMTPRLKLLWEFLTDDGAIFVSIDDKEVHRLRELMDEIFGEEKFIATNIWQKRYSRENREAIGDVHEYVIVYGKDPDEFKRRRHRVPLDEKQARIYKNPNNDPKGRWRAIPMTAQGYRANQMYPITAPGGAVHHPPEGRCWSMIEEEFQKLLAAGRIYFGKDNNSQPNVIRYLSEVEGMVPWTWWPHTEVGHTDEAKKEIYSILGKDADFDTPKPSRLIKRIVQIATDSGDTVLDSFAGSGTTAHAVLDANVEDAGNRQFILVQCDEYSRKAGKIVDICDSVTARRVRRVIKGVKRAKQDDQKKGLGGTFSYFDLGPAIEMESILSGDSLPTYHDLARYVFYTATGEEFDESAINEKKNFIGESKQYLVYLFYDRDLEYLKKTALTLDIAKGLGAYKGKRRLVFAPTKYLDQDHLDELRIDFAQLPFEIYQLVK